MRTRSQVQLLRTDAHAHLLDVARVLARCSDWDTATTRPTWDRLCDQTGLARRTVAKWLAWLRSQGLLGVVETGSTPALRPMALAQVEGNRAALYVLTAPVPTQQLEADQEHESACSVDRTCTPSVLTVGEDPSRTRGASRSPLRGPDRRNGEETPRPWSWQQPATHHRDRLACAARLRDQVPALRRLSTRHVRHLLRPWLKAGWSAADLAHAIDRAPDGTAHTWTSDVRRPQGWLRHRLAPWTDATGNPLPPPSASHRAALEHRRAAQAAHRDQTEARHARLRTEHEHREHLAQLEPETWSLLRAHFARGRRAPGPMSDAQARAAVLAELPAHVTDPITATDDQLRAAAFAAAARVLLAGIR